ncbi:nucleoside diphosphatase [Trypanosoma brucei equiperdum]|uniref:Nucleoside diphosphatase n=1 Tax=Trypanosoma brucei equiperdum TaxID=630700 RepID=A0A3L6L3Q0_9TRYP|nr:nucleoside diphosphatase [Trypanosoma brucei equiperdum]
MVTLRMAARRRGLHAKRNWHVSVFLFLGLTFLVALFALLSLITGKGSDNSDPPKSTTGLCDTPLMYDILLDAGSTGTRVHIFEYNKWRLVGEVYNSTHPGLSQLASDDSANISANLQPLMATAVRAIPEVYHPCTKVTLKATAGLRLLPPEKVEFILRETKKVLRRYPFVVGSVSVMDGDEEGMDAWLTVAYLLGLFDRSAEGTPNSTAKRIATIDMGGASTQLVLQMSPGYTGETQFITSLHFGVTEIPLYTYSFLGLGLRQATLEVLRELTAVERTSFPCFPSRYRHRIDGEGGVSFVENIDGNAQGFGACLRFFHRFINTRSSEHLAALRGGRHVLKFAEGAQSVEIFAFSFFHRLWRLRPADNVTVQYYKELGEQVYSAGGKHNSGTNCMDVAYLYGFLTSGLGLSDKTKLNVPYVLNDVKVTWALGASLLSMEGKVWR